MRNGPSALARCVLGLCYTRRQRGLGLRITGFAGRKYYLGGGGNKAT